MLVPHARIPDKPTAAGHISHISLQLTKCFSFVESHLCNQFALNLSQNVENVVAPRLHGASMLEPSAIHSYEPPAYRNNPPSPSEGPPPSLPFHCAVLESADSLGGPSPALLHALREQGCKLILAQVEDLEDGKCPCDTMMIFLLFILLRCNVEEMSCLFTA